MIFYNSKSDMFFCKDEYSIVPNDSRLCDENAKNYYLENKEKFNINLDNISGDKITLDGIMEYGVVPEAVKAIKIGELKAKLDETDYKIVKCSEYQFMGLLIPYDMTKLHLERQELRNSINEIENSML